MENEFGVILQNHSSQELSCSNDSSKANVCRNTKKVVNDQIEIFWISQSRMMPTTFVCLIIILGECINQIL